MSYGICNLSIIPLRAEPDDKSEMVSQLLFGEHFIITETKKNWNKIQLAFDGYEGWIDAKQFVLINKSDYQKLENKSPHYIKNLVDFITDENSTLKSLTIGSSLPFYKNNTTSINNTNFKFEGEIINSDLSKKDIINIAFMYLNAPYLWGGKTPFGIDCSGFTQMVYKLCGFKLKRDASEQAKQGEVLSFIEESEPGDLAFFDNAEGEITHVGIMMQDNYIIHAHGKVRIDRLDHSGIYNVDTKRHTHTLRVIKKMI